MVLATVLAKIVAIVLLSGCSERKETPDPTSQQTQSPPPNTPEENGFFTLGSQEYAPLGDPWPFAQGNRTIETKIPQGLLIATVDPLAMPWKAQVYAINTSTEKSPEKLLSGESSDPIFRPIKDEIWMLNRSHDSQNFRALGAIFPSSGEPIKIGPQLRFTGGFVGDPHDILRIGNLILLAHYNEGQLVLMDAQTYQEKGRIEAPWDLPDGIKLKPSALVWSYDQRNQKSYIYVVHQALNIVNGVYGTNNTQQIFVLSFDHQEPNQTPQTVDLNPDLPKIQGIKLKGSFPVPLRFYDSNRLVLVSMCSRFSLMTPPSEENPPCQSAVEEINLKDHSSQVLWELDNLSPRLFMNGPVVAGHGELSFFANIERQETQGKFSQVVALFELGTKKVRDIYTFRPYSGGFWATFFDPKTKLLFVGDTGTQGAVGNLLIIDPQSSPGRLLKEIPLEGVPYSGSWVYPKKT
jgi:hypothetical protein